MPANSAVLKEAVVERSALDFIRLAQAGDADAFGCLYDEYIERIYRYIFFRVTDEQTAEDLASHVFTKAWENLHRYKPSGAPFVAWLYTIARNAVIDYYRTHKETVGLDQALSIASDGPHPEEQIDIQFESEALRHALGKLTPDQEQVVTMKFIAGMSTEEIADHLGKQPGAIRALQMRALQSLARIMQTEDIFERV